MSRSNVEDQALLRAGERRARPILRAWILRYSRRTDMGSLARSIDASNCGRFRNCELEHDSIARRLYAARCAIELHRGGIGPIRQDPRLSTAHCAARVQ